MKKTTEEFIKEARNKYKDRFDYSMVSYINNYTKVKIKCNLCGKYFLITPKNHFRGQGGCKSCSSRLASLSTKQEFIQKAKQLHKNKYNYSLVDYVDSRTKVKIICNKCGKIFEQTPKAHLQGENCSYCKSSLSEEKILNFLLKNNIKFETQKTFPNLKDKKMLSYDFYIPSKNLLIEYNGIQHYEIVNYFGGYDRLIIQKQHDKMKQEYAKNNNINLLIISYKDDIYKILKENLNG